MTLPTSYPVCIVSLEPEEDMEPLVFSTPGTVIQAKIYEKRNKKHEETSRPFSPRLRYAARMGMLLTLGTALLLHFFMPAISQHIAATFFPFWLQGLNHVLTTYLTWLLEQSRWIGYFDGCLLGSGSILLVLTRNLHRGNTEQHWLGFFQALGGVGNTSLLVIPLVLYLPNLLLWILSLIATILLLSLLLSILRLLCH